MRKNIGNTNSHWEREYGYLPGVFGYR